MHVGVESRRDSTHSASDKPVHETPQTEGFSVFLCSLGNKLVPTSVVNSTQ